MEEEKVENGCRNESSCGIGWNGSLAFVIEHFISNMKKNRPYTKKTVHCTISFNTSHQQCKLQIQFGSWQLDKQEILALFH